MRVSTQCSRILFGLNTSPWPNIQSPRHDGLRMPNRAGRGWETTPSPSREPSSSSPGIPGGQPEPVPRLITQPLAGWRRSGTTSRYRWSVPGVSPVGQHRRCRGDRRGAGRAGTPSGGLLRLSVAGKRWPRRRRLRAGDLRAEPERVCRRAAPPCWGCRPQPDAARDLSTADHATVGGVPGGIRTHTVGGLSSVSLPVGIRGQWRRQPRCRVIEYPLR